MTHHEGPARPQSLTIQQRRCVELLSYGQSTPQIATHLGVSRNTVKTHLKQAFKTLGVHDRAQAVRVCFERGIFQVGVSA